MTKQVIDISEHNLRRGVIDWQRVKESGVFGVMLRAGWAGYEGGIVWDESIEESIMAAHRAKLHVGLYLYSYTKSPQAAHRSAAEITKFAERFMGIIDMPLAFDVEETNLPCLIGQGKQGLTDTVIAFLFEVQRSGWRGVFYTYTAFALTYLDMRRLAAREMWVADYRADEKIMREQLGREISMWQYAGESGKCDGVTGPCDRNHCYVDYPLEIAKSFQNGLLFNTSAGGAQ